MDFSADCYLVSFLQDVNLWKLMGDFNLHGITAPGEPISYPFFAFLFIYFSVSAMFY